MLQHRVLPYYLCLTRPGHLNFLLQSRVSRPPWATTWTNTISNDGTVEQVAELLGLSRDYTQQRSVQLRKELREHGVELPKVQNRRKKVKDTASVAPAVADLLKQVDELDAAH